MLLSLHIRNFTIAEELEIEFSAGSTAITGETGAGKSLVVDALGMALGDRADTDTIRLGADRAEITASFDVSRVNEARQWLLDNDFSGDDCILRRLYTREGRSRGYINGQTCTMQQLQELGDMLTDIHSQHEHQSLLRPATHRRLLDEFAECTDLAAEVANLAKQIQTLQSQLGKSLNDSAEIAARRELLHFQIAELRELGLGESEIGELEAEQLSLANAGDILASAQNVMAICAEQDEFNIQDALNRAISLLSSLKYRPDSLQNALDLLGNGLIQVEEAIQSLRELTETFDTDPQRQQFVEERLSAAYQLARKHRVQAADLPARLVELEVAIAALDSAEDSIEALQAKIEVLEKNFDHAAQSLSGKRKNAASRLEVEINQRLDLLALKGASFKVNLASHDDNERNPSGLESVEFQISTNPGQPHKALQKIASGGELSRISLAIHVVCAEQSSIPTLIFDEVDVGIGGGTADIVGQLLRELGQRGQVISVTHQPQVAARAHHHYQASKLLDQRNAASMIRFLEGQQRVEELARMLSGAEITPKTRSLASEMLQSAK